MSTVATPSHPLSWIKKVNEELFSLQKDSTKWPLFPWREFEQRMQALFRLESSHFSYKEVGIVEPNQIGTGISKEFLVFSIHIQAVNGKIFFILGENDAKGLMAALLGGSATAAFFLEQDALFSFGYYLAAESLRTAESLDWLPLGLRVDSEISKNLPEISEKSVVSEISWTTSNGSFFGKVIVPYSVYLDCITKIEVPIKSFDIREADPLLTLDLSVEVGFSRLSIEEWSSVKKGDFVVLDGCFFDPDEQEGGAFLSVNEGKPLFSGRFMEDGISFKITGYPTQEVDMYDEDMEHDLEEEDHAMLTAEEEQRRAQALKQFPCRLTVEVGRVKMSLEEIMKLTPGSIVSLGTSPEKGVDLVINGAKVGQGELVSLGDMLGVRVLKL